MIVLIGVGGTRIVGQCQAAVAEAVEAFGRLDILFCCESEGLWSAASLGNMDTETVT